ncbi:MAG: ATP-binding protein, partial [Pseudomonadota bacterium]
LANLVDNAVRHGGPTLSEVRLAVERPGAHALSLSVSDNGRGIPAADVGRATERFSQLSPREGSGLGLAIVSAVADAHGGALELVALEPGLQVAMRLPAADDTL